MSISERLDEIDFSRLIPIKGDKTNLKIGKIIIETKSSSRRVELKSEVKFFLQKYISQDERLILASNDYKNIVKKNIDKMSLEEATLRDCLLSLEDDQIVWMVLDKSVAESLWNKAKLSLKLETDPDPYFYFKINIVSIISQQPTEPKDINLYHNYVKRFKDEIRYFIRKENYTEAEKWANSIMSKFLTPSKETKILLDKHTDKRMIILEEFKSIILNKTLALMEVERPDKSKDYDNIIKHAIEYKKYFQTKDEQYLKITLRQIKSYIYKKDIDNAEYILKEIEALNSKVDIKSELEQLHNSLTQLKNDSKNSGIRFKFNLKCSESITYEWDTALKKVNTASSYENAILNMII
jgi:hypothetical protein